MIQFHSEIGFELPQADKYTNWINDVVVSLGSRIGELNYIFCSDEDLLNINKEHLGHNYYTDIITFPFATDPGLISDIYISIDRVRDNADNYNVEFEEELRRVMIHGVLHMLGFDDKDKEQRDQMRQGEEAALKMFHVKH